MQRWKRLILAGNRSFEMGRIDQARAAYAEALFEAERQLADQTDINDAIAAYVTTRHNLADLFDAIDEPERAMCHLRTAHGRLLRLIAEADGRPRQLLAALKHCHRTRAELLRYALSQGFDEPDDEPRPIPTTAALLSFPGSAAH